MIDFKAVGCRIKEARREKELTQEKLAEMLDVSTEHISRIESGACRPSLLLIERIGEALQAEEQYLLFGKPISASGLHETQPVPEGLTDRQKAAFESLIDAIIHP